MLRFFGFIVTSFLVALVSKEALAVDYDHATIRLNCKIHGSRQSVTQSETIFARTLYLGFEAKSAFPVNDSNSENRNFYEWTQFKISETENADPLTKSFPPGGRPFELLYVPKSTNPITDFMSLNSNLHDWSYQMNLNIPLTTYGEILEALGELSHPDFKKDVPTIDWKPIMAIPGKIEFSAAHYGQSGAVESYWRVFNHKYKLQAHYSEDKFDGLSYNVYLDCR